MGLVSKITRLIRGRAYRSAVKNTAATITHLVEVLKDTLLSYEVEEAVITLLDRNKTAIEAIDWKSIQDALATIGDHLEKNMPIVKAFSEAAQANIDLMKAEFDAQDKNEEE